VDVPGFHLLPQRVRREQRLSIPRSDPEVPGELALTPHLPLAIRSAIWSIEREGKDYLRREDTPRAR